MLNHSANKSAALAAQSAMCRILFCLTMAGLTAASRADGATFNVLTFGATGGGVTDDTIAIQKTITAAKAAGNGSIVYFPGGTYLYSTTLTFDRMVAQGAATASTTLIAIDSNNSSLTLTGASPSATGLTIRTKTAPTVRNINPAATGIHIYKANGFIVSNLNITQVASAGILVRQSAGPISGGYAQIQNCVISNNLADGIHVTEVSAHIEVHDNTLKNTGDDFIAVVSYRTNGAVCSDILIHDNTGDSQLTGRGITAIGAQTLNISNNHVMNTTGSGIYLASESSYDTYGVNGVTISNNTIDRCPKTLLAGHAGLTLLGRANSLPGGSPFEIKNIIIENNRISNSAGHGLYLGAYSSGINLTGNVIVGVSKNGITVGPLVTDIAIGSTATGAAQNRVQSCGQYGIQVDPSGSQGTLQIRGVLFQSVNTNNLGSIDVINIAKNGSFVSTFITDNQLNQPADLRVDRFVEALSPITELTGNTANITLASIYTTNLGLAKPTDVRVNIQAVP